MENELWMHATTQGTFYDYDDTTSVLQFDGFQTSAYDYFTDSNSNGDVLNTTNVTEMSLFLCILSIIGKVRLRCMGS